MIARLWHGWTTAENADAYEALLRSEVLTGIAAMHLPGYHGAHVLRRPHGDEVEFITVLWFDTMEGSHALSGDEQGTSYVPAKARALLARFDTSSQHYDTVIRPS